MQIYKQQRSKEVDPVGRRSPAAIRAARFFGMTTEMLCVVDADFAILDANPAWEKVTGYSIREAPDASLMQRLHEEDRSAVLTAFKRLPETGEPIELEARLLCSDGGYRWLSLQALHYDEGIYLAARDLTERKEFEQRISDAYQKLTFYMMNSPLAFVEWDRDLRVSYWSPEAERVFGWEPDGVLDKSPCDWRFAYEEDDAAFVSVLAGLIADQDQPQPYYGRHYRQDGSIVHCEWYHSVLRNGEGEAISIFSLALDVTAKRQAEADLMTIRKAVESAGDAICITDERNKIIHLNQSFIDLFGYSLEALNAVGLDALIADAVQQKQMRAMIDSGLSWKGEVEMRCADDSLVPVIMRADAVRTENGDDLGNITVCTDLSERKQVERELLYQAMHDSLTGLPNRSAFMQRLNRVFARRKPGGAEIACLFVDLDNFKIVNDSLGHEAGDALIKTIADRLLSCVRTEDMVARLGGDEFVILIDNVTADEATNAAERVSSHLMQPLTLLGRELIVTASIGIATSHPNHEKASELLKDADVAMYQAKTGGKAGYVSFDSSMNAEAMERLELEMDLRRAIELNELHLYFQPIVQLASGRITEAEALLRWIHPQRGMISPVKFIPIAEETGLIVAMGEWVLEHACRRAVEWQAQSPNGPPLTMSVNLAPRQLLQHDIVDRVRAVLERTGMSAGLLKLEITESVMMLDPDVAVQKLLALQELGIRIAVDDFGTGYSSMAYLSRFPIDTLKIDRAFISRLGLRSEDDAIVRAILMMAKTMGLFVTAEGIETDAQLGELQALGCDRGQGYYFSTPLAEPEFASLLETQGKQSAAQNAPPIEEERRAA